MNLLALTDTLLLNFVIVYGAIGIIAFLAWQLVRLASPPLTYAVFQRNVVSYFSNPIGYLFIVAFTLTGAYFAFWHNDKFFASNLCDLSQLSSFFPYVLLFFIPAITMSIWADERRSGTEELLLTLPGSDLQVVVGKYLSALAIYSVALAFLGLLYFVLDWLGTPDGGLVISTFVGYWLIGAALLAAGMVASLLTANVTVAFILGAAICMLLVAVHNLGAAFGGSRSFRFLLDNAGIVSQFEPFSRGVISIGSVVYFIAVAAVMLYLNVVLLSRRHWEGGSETVERWGNYLIRALAILVAGVSLTMVARSVSSRWSIDATQERLHTLSKDTASIVDEIDPKRPVLIEAYLSPDPPKDYEQTRRDLVDLLERFDAMGGDRVEVQIYDTEPFSPIAKEAEKVYNIRPQDVMVEEDSRRGVEQVFMGVAFKSGLNEKVIPFFWRALPVEYELARTIRSVSQANRMKVGVLGTDANLFGQFDMQMMRPGEDWLIVNELRQQYEVVRVGVDTEIPEDIKVLIVPMASSLTDPQLDILVNYVKAGRPALILDDPAPLSRMDLAAMKPKAPPRSPMMGMPPPQTAPKGNLAKLTNLLNIKFDAANVVFQQWNPVVELQQLPPEFVFVGPGSGNAEAFNPDEPATSGLQQLVMFYPGSIQSIGGDGPKVTPLLATGKSTGTVRWNDAIEDNFMGMSQPNPRPRRLRTGRDYILAAHIQGKLADAAKQAEPAEGEKPAASSGAGEVNVIFIADLDVVSDEFFRLRQQATEETLRFDNVTFVMNCVDVLAGEEGFVELRKKRPKRRTLDRIETMVENSKREEAISIENAQVDAEKELAKSQKQLDDEVSKIEKDESIPSKAMRAQRAELARAYWQKNFDLEKTKVEQKRDQTIQELRDEAKSKRRDEERRVKWLAVLIPPIPALLVGLVVFFRRQSAETEGVDPSRLV